MKKPTQLLLILSLVLLTTYTQAQDAKQKGLDAITLQAVQGQLEFLSSDWTEGRATGSQGAYMAADYIASMFNICIITKELILALICCSKKRCP